MASETQEPYRQEGDPKIIPAAYHIRHAGHHWVQLIDFDGRPAGNIVLQWQPHARRWCLPNNYARGIDFDVSDYRYLAPCVMPLFEHDNEQLLETMKTLDAKADEGGDGVVMTHQQWEFLRRLIYPMIH